MLHQENPSLTDEEFLYFHIHPIQRLYLEIVRLISEIVTMERCVKLHRKIRYERFFLFDSSS